MTPSHQILVGDCLELLRQMPDQSVHCCVTSPPYFGLRDYGVDGQIGLEETPAEFIGRLVEVFREVRRVLRDDGTCWVNMGDSYATGGRGGGGSYMAERGDGAWKGRGEATGWRSAPAGLKHKDLMGMPWRLAFALQDDGWYLRQDIIWHKPNPMPESIRDRCTKAHEYLFLLSKSRRYYFDQAAISEPLAPSSVERLAQQGWDEQEGSDRVPGKTNGAMEAVGGKRSKRYSFARETKATAGEHGQKGQHRPDRPDIDYSDKRKKRSVWSVATVGFKGAHFATFPPDLIRPCILAGAPREGLVLDPFGGAGTTGLVAMQEGRRSILCELNPGYADIAQARLDTAWIEGAAQLDIFNDSKVNA
ncbi:DNA methylase [compost metagenome]